MPEDEIDEARLIVGRVGTFTIRLSQPWYQENGPLPAHDKVLRPVLHAASECWAYGIEPGGAVRRSADDILEREKGKHRVRLGGDPIRGHELFWNAHGGKRGTIVIVVPRRKFDAKRIFRGGQEVFVAPNFLTGHSPAAIRFARKRVEASDDIAICLPQNNGIEWMDVFVRPKLALDLFDVAVRNCRPSKGKESAVITPEMAKWMRLLTDDPA